MPEKKLRARRSPDGYIETAWFDIRDKVLKAVAETTGHRGRKSKDCFDDNDKAINELLAQRHLSHAVHLADPTNMIKRNRYLNLKSIVQRKLKQIKDWFKRKAELFQNYAYNNDIRPFYYDMKTVYGPSSNAKTPICDCDGKPLINIDAI